MYQSFVPVGKFPFDSVSHSKLMAKMRMYGMCRSLLQWIDDLLICRSYRTRIDNSWSDVAHITSGVIEGSYLGLELVRLCLCCTIQYNIRLLQS